MNRILFLAVFFACALRPCLAASPGGDAQPWWGDAVFYQIFTRSFQDSRSGPLANDGVGDIQGIIDRLDYLNDGDPATASDLGITGIWLLPMAESVHAAGYSVIDYKTIQHDYGTNDDFRRLIEEAHRRGIRIIVDLVLNHASNRHPWFVASAAGEAPYRDYFMWRDERPTEHGESFARKWSQFDNGRWAYSAFGRGIPDLNVEHPAVKAELFEIARFWLEDMGVDGFRLDAIKHMVEEGANGDNTEGTHRWLREFQAYCKSVKPDCFIVGEVWSGTGDVARYTPDQVDACFQFELAGSMISAAMTEHIGFLPAVQSRVVESMPAPHYAPFLTNHDMMRVMEQLDRRPGRMRVAASLLLTAPGVPFVYYGEEVGINGHNSQGRSPMQWSAEPHAGFSTVEPYRALAEEWEEFNVAAHDADKGSILSHYRTLIRLRSEQPALRRGKYVPLQVVPPDMMNFVVADQTSAAAFGYEAVEGGGVLFVFDPARYTLPEGLNAEAIQSVSVAGDFNNWAPGEWPMERRDDGLYILAKDHRPFSIDAHEFKFVVNGDGWIEPAQDMPNRKHAGLAQESYNLVLRRSDDLRVDACITQGDEVEFLFRPDGDAVWRDATTGEPVESGSFDAAKVTVAGTFNDWSTDALPLLRGDDGVWRGKLPGGRVAGRRDEFRFLLDGKVWVTPTANTHNASPARDGAPVYAFLRQLDGESLLCVINLSADPVTKYGIVLGDKLAGVGVPSKAEVLLGANAPSLPLADPAGGYQPYRPYAALPGHSCSIIRLAAGATPAGN